MDQQDFLGVTLVLCLFLSLFMGLACWTDRSLDYVVSEIRGKEVNVPWYLSAAATCAAPLVVPFNIGCEIFRVATDD